MATFGNEFINSRASTDVNVVGFAGNALDGILKAIQATKEATEDLADKIDEAGDRQGKKDAKDKVASVASERRQRAANAAIHGKVNKSLSAIDALTDALKDMGKKILDILGSMAKESLRAYDDTTRNLRKQFLTTAQIEQNLLKADKAKMALEEMGIKVNSSETKNIVSALVEAQVDTSKLSEVQIAAIAMMNKTMGTDVKTALSIVKASTDPSKIISMAVQASDTTGREATAKLMQSVNETWFARYAQTVGGTENAISEFQKAAKSLDAALGDYGLGSDTQKGLLETALKISSGQIEKVKQDEIANMLAISGDAMKSPEKLVEGIQKMITRTDLTQQEKIDKLRVLDDVEGINKEFITSLQNAIVAQGNGKYEQKNIRGAEDNIDAINQAQKGGRVGGFIDKMITGLNVATGGIFSDMSAGLNEWFGESLGVEEIVSNGFKLVCTLLAAIATSALISKGGALLASLTAGLGGLGGIAGLGGVPGILNTPDAPNGPNSRGSTPDAPNGPNSRGSTPDAPNGRSGANALRNTRALKGLKALGGVGTVLGVGLTAAEIYSIHSAPDTTVASESSSEKFKEEEKKAQDEIKTAKTAGVIAEAGIAAGGAIAGAKIGAMIGAAGGPLGIAAGALIGTAIGGVGSIVVGNITDSIEKTKNVEIGIKNVKDLEDQLTELDTLIAKEGDQDTERKRKLLELRAQVLKDLENATKSNINTLITNFNSHNEDFANSNADAMSQIAEQIKQKQDELKEYEEKNKSISDTTGYKNKVESINKEMLTLRQAMTGLAGGEFKVEEGEALGDAIKRIAADVRGDGYFDTREDVEYHAAKTNDEMEKFLKQQALDKLTNGVMHEALDDLKQHDVKTIEEFVKQSKLGVGLSEKALRELTGEVIKLAKNDAAYNEWQMQWEQQNANNPTHITFAANGGIFNKATNAVIGEAGKEAVVPLERPEDMRRVLSTLSSSEKFKLIKALLSTNSKKLTWDLLSNVMLKTLGIGSFGPTAQEKSEYDVALAKLDAWQGGKLKPADFIAMFGPIAREDMRATGIPAAITIAQAALESGWGKTAKSDFRNLFGIKGKGDAGSKIIPTHEYNTAGIRYNKRDTFAQYSSYLASINAHSQYLLTAKRKKGLNGLRYGEALLYTDDSDMFARKLKECGYATSPTYAEKLIGLMRQHDMYRYNISSSAVRPGSTLNHIKNSTDFKAASATKSTTNGTVNKAQGILSDTEIKEILSAAGLSNTTTMKQYIEYAKLLVGNANSKDDIIAVLLEIARYLKGIAASPANKPPMMSVARPYTPAYGT